MSIHNRDSEMDVEEEGDMVLFDQANLLTNRIKCKNNDIHGGFKLKLLKTLALCAAFLGLGLCFAVLGPTLLDLRCHVDTDISHISYVFTGRSLGYLLGSIIGGCLFDKFNQLLLLSFALFLTSVATGLAPWSSQLMVLAVAIGVQGLTMGFLDTGGNVLCLTLWGKKSGPFMQALHFAFGIGAFISPLIAQPFLAAQEICPNNNLELSYVGKMLYSSDALIPTNMTGINKRDVNFIHPDYFLRKEREIKLEENYINKDFLNSSLFGIFELDNSSFPEVNKTENISLYFNSNKTEVNTLDTQLNETRGSNFSVMQPNKTEVSNLSDIQTNAVNSSNTGAFTTPSSSVQSLTNTTIKPKKPKPGTDGKFLPPEEGRGPIWNHKEVPSNKLPKTVILPLVTTVIPIESSSVNLSNYSLISNETLVPQNETSNSTSGQLLDNSTSSNLNTSSVSKNVDSNLMDALTNTTMNHEMIKNSSLSLQNYSLLNQSISEQVNKNEGDNTTTLTSSTTLITKSTNNAVIDNILTKESIPTTTVSTLNIELSPTLATHNFSSTQINEKARQVLNLNEINKISSKHTISSTIPSSLTDVNSKSHKTHSSRHKIKSPNRSDKTTSKKKLPHSNEVIPGLTSTFPPDNTNNFDSIYKTPIVPVTPVSSDNGVIINDSNPTFNNHVPFSHPISINISSSNLTYSDISTPLSNFSTVVSSISTSTPLTKLDPINSTVVSLVSTSTPLTNVNPISSDVASSVKTLKPVINSDSISSTGTIISSTSKTIKPYSIINGSSNEAKDFLIISRIQFAYLIIAVFIFQTSIAFLVFFGIGSHNLRAIMPVDCQTQDDHYSRSALRFQLLGLLFIFYFMYVGMEATYGGLLMTFSVCSKLHLTNSFGAYITSLFWGMFALARGFAIYFAKWFSPAAMLRTNLFLCIIASVILVFFAETYSWILWFGSGLLGVGMASIFPTGITWVEQYIDMSNKEASILVVGSALGEMLLPVLAGHFFKTFNPMFLMYLILSLCVLCVIVYIFMEKVANSFGDKYGFLLLNMQTVGSSQTESMEDKMENEALIDSDTVPMLNGSSKTKSVRFSPSSENKTKSTKNE